MTFTSGLTLSCRFHEDIVRPWLTQAYPGLRHAAALIGSGSELLGFDDAMSRDHNWGPRLQLYLGAKDFEVHARRMVQSFASVMPETFLGEPIGFVCRPNPPPDRPGAIGDMRHGLEIHTVDAMLRHELALEPDEPRDNPTWLGLAEQQLLTITAGAVFHDDDGHLTALRQRLHWFPRDVWLYKLAAQWDRVAEEQAFVGRTGIVGDDLGSRMIAARLAHDVMRLGFLIDRRYAPYAKWFGTAFARLPCAHDLVPILNQALTAPDWQTRQQALAGAYAHMAGLHRDRGLPGDVQPIIGPFFDRPFIVINAHEIAAAIACEIQDPALRALPLIGGLDQVTDSTAVTTAPVRSRRMMASTGAESSDAVGLNSHCT